MTRYLISFDDGTMVIPDGELEQVADDAHAVVAQSKQAGVYVHGGGVVQDPVTVVGTDGSVSPGPERSGPFVGGFVILDLPSHDAALEWAGRFAVACRCAQEVRALGDDPEA